MKSLKFRWLGLMLISISIAYGQQKASPASSGVKLSAGAALLFKDVPSKLSNEEKNFLFKETGFVLSANREQPFAQDKESLEYPFGATVLPTDLNKDGHEEIFLSFGNTYTSGMAGSSIILFIKDAAGVYKQNLGFPGTIPDALATSFKGYPDLVIGGPGFEFPVWRWYGKEYALYRKIKDSDLQKANASSIEALSKLYTGSLKP